MQSARCRSWARCRRVSRLTETRVLGTRWLTSWAISTTNPIFRNARQARHRGTVQLTGTKRSVHGTQVVTGSFARQGVPIPS